MTDQTQSGCPLAKRLYRILFGQGIYVRNFLRTQLDIHRLDAVRNACHSTRAGNGQHMPAFM